MSIDFNNRATPGSTDPNAVVSVTPSNAEYWIKVNAQGEWQGPPTNDPTVGAQAGYIPVSVGTVLLNDGRLYRAILDSNTKEPISEVGDQLAPTDASKQQATTFHQGQTASTSGSGQQLQRGADGMVYQWDPNGQGQGRGGYTIPRPDLSPAQIVTAPSTEPNVTTIKPGEGGAITSTPNPNYRTPWAPEGRPDSSKPGGYDNSRPIMVTHKADGSIGETREPTTEELAKWRADQAASQTAVDRKLDPDHPGYFIVTTKNPQTQVIETHYEDANNQTVPPPPPGKPTLTTQTINGQPGYVTQLTPGVNGQPPKIEYFGPDGKPIPSLPAEAGKDVPTTVTGSDGQQYTLHTVTKPDGTGTSFYTLPGSDTRVTPPGQGLGAFAPETTVPPMGTNPQEVAQGLMAYSAQLAEQVRLWQQDPQHKQGLSPSDATAKMEARTKLADVIINNQNTALNTQATLRGQDITERGQTIQDTNARRTAATGLYNQTLASFLPQIRYLAPGKGANMAAAMQANLQGGLDYANAWGGQQAAPPVGYSGFPNLNQIRANSNAAITTAASGGPRIFDPRAVSSPPPVDVTGSGAPSSATLPLQLLPPNQPVSAQDVAANVAAATAQQGASSPPAPAVNPISAAPIPSPPLNQGQDLSTPNGAPVPPMPPGVVSMVPRFVQQARYGRSFDPHAAAADMAARLSIHPQIMQQAVNGLYG